jgi:hypothetical protein
MPVFSVLPSAGDRFYLTGQQNIPGGAPSVSFVLIGPDGTFAKTSLADYSGADAMYGKTMYIFRDRWAVYWVTDTMQTKKQDIFSLKSGTWTLKMVDDTANVILNEFTVSIAGNGSFVANPLAPKTIWTNSTDLSLTNSSGYSIPFTNNGVVPFTGPNGLRMFRYNGTGAYIQGEDNPDLDYTGDLSLSLWLQPTTTIGYHQIVGKGQSGDTNENYDMFLIDKKLYFEWTDPVTNTPWHIMTNNDMTWGSPPSLNYVTMTINSGTPIIYFGGVVQPVTSYHSNNPGNNPQPLSNGINLSSNNNPITIGRQNYPGAYFYYAGNMSEVSFYNRALTPAEIAANKNNYQT